MIGPRRVTVIAAAVTTLLLVAVIAIIRSTSGGGGSGKASGSGGSGAATCSWGSAAPAARRVSKPPSDPPHSGTVQVAVSTTQGAMSFTLDRAATACTVASFVSLAQQHYFDGTACHRLTTAGIFVLQCGDPTGTGTGGPGYTIPDELTGSETYPSGVLAMANTGRPDTGGSQFFIVWKDTPLPPQYTVFGTVTAGLSTVLKVAAAGVIGGGTDGHPARAITLTSVVAQAS